MTRTANPHPMAVKLRRIRLLRGLSQCQLAERIGVGRHDVGNWETGRFDPRLLMATAWANALGYDLAPVLIPRRRDPGWCREMQDPPRRSSGTAARVVNTPKTPTTPEEQL